MGVSDIMCMETLEAILRKRSKGKYMFQSIRKDDYALFQEIMIEYYREGEDAETSIDTVKAFIDSLFRMVCNGEIDGVFSFSDNRCEGFCLWMKDEEQRDFSEMPGCGTILEIGVRRGFRKRGVGTKIVEYAEQQMRKMGVDAFYVSAYGPAEAFWEKCGYEKTEKKASNGLTVFLKSASE